MCTKSAKSASGALDAHFVMSQWYTHAYLNADFEYAHEHVMQTFRKLNADFLNAHLVQTMCTLYIAPLLSSSRLVAT